MIVLYGEEAMINDKPNIYKCIVCQIETEDYDEFGHCVECNNSICYSHIVDDCIEFCDLDCCVTYYYCELLWKLSKYKNALGYVGMRVLYIYVQKILERCDTIPETDDEYAEIVHLLKENHARGYGLNIEIIEDMLYQLDYVLDEVEDYPGFRLLNYGTKGRGPHMWQKRCISTQGNRDMYFWHCHEVFCPCCECCD